MRINKATQLAMVMIAGLATGCCPSAATQAADAPASSKPDKDAVHEDGPPPRGGPRSHALLQAALAATEAQTLEAVVEIDAKPGSKAFQGVWLKRKEGEQLLVDYRAHRYWRSFEGRRCMVTGKPYVPAGQAIMADHFRVEHIRIADLDYQNASEADMALELIELWAERSYHGKFIREEIPPGQKLSGESFTYFVSDDGKRFLLYDQREQVSLNKPVTIKARQVEPSRFIARLGGPYLWVTDIE